MQFQSIWIVIAACQLQEKVLFTDRKLGILFFSIWFLIMH